MPQVLYLMKVPGKETPQVRLQWLGECFRDYAGRAGVTACKEEFLASLYKGEDGKPETRLPEVNFNISHSFST